jgi:hypothetical protein
MAQAAARRTRKLDPSDPDYIPTKPRRKLAAVTDTPVIKEAPKGDESLTLETMSLWKDGQKRCRARKRHDWKPYNVYKHRGYYEVVERCSQCLNRRVADFVETSRGLRKSDDGWQIDYRDNYLLPKGAMRIDEDIYDELVASDILSRKMVEVEDD